MNDSWYCNKKDADDVINSPHVGRCRFSMDWYEKVAQESMGKSKQVTGMGIPQRTRGTREFNTSREKGPPSKNC